MADEEIEQKPYTLLTDQGEQLQGSYNFSGSGTAEYPTGDRYEGQFLQGVKILTLCSNLNLYLITTIEKKWKGNLHLREWRCLHWKI
jgi:hypothetical protein